MKSVSSLIGHCRHSERGMADLRIERSLAVLARFARLPRYEAEIAGAERGAVARDRRNVVARLEGLVLDLSPAPGTAAITWTSMVWPVRENLWCRFDVDGGMFLPNTSCRTS